jgi:hypothetical protein
VAAVKGQIDMARIDRQADRDDRQLMVKTSAEQQRHMQQMANQQQQQALQAYQRSQQPAPKRGG